MDVWRLLVAALRNWPVLLIMLGLTALAVDAAGERVQSEYQTDASLLLFQPAGLVDDGNPYSSPSTAAQALDIVVSSDASRAAFAAAGLEREFDISTNSRSPILSVEVLADQPDVALATTRAVVDAVTRELTERQSAVGIPPEGQLQLLTLAEPTEVEVVQEGRFRAQVMTGVIGVVLSFLAAVLIDDLLLLLRRRRRNRQAAGDDETLADPERESTFEDVMSSADADERPRPSRRVPAGSGLRRGDR